MKNKPQLDAEDGKRIVDAAEAHALHHKWAVAIAVVDDGGHLLAFRRLDGCAPASIKIAIGKAHTAAIRRKPTKADEDMVANGRTAALSMPDIVFLEGGLPIVIDGEVAGAVGVSGVKSSDDATIALAGIAALA